MQSYSQKIFAGQQPVFDGRKNMYSKDPLPIGRDKVGYLSDTLGHCVDDSPQSQSFGVGRCVLCFLHFGQNKKDQQPRVNGKLRWCLSIEMSCCTQTAQVSLAV